MINMKTPKGNSFNYNVRKYFMICFLTAGFFCNTAHSKIVTIKVQDYKFSPEYVHVSTGDVIRWIWIGPSSYSIVCDGEFPGTSLPHGASGWDFQINSSGTVYETRISVAGVYDYVCSNAVPLLTGRIVAETPLPVELLDFVATTIKNEVILDWSTLGEVNNDRFEIQRINITNLKDLNPDDYNFTTIGVLHGNGTSSSNHEYKFHDKNLRSGVYMYRLKQIDYNSNYFYHLLNGEIIIGIPDKFTVLQNYPNPFNPSTNIDYEIPADGNVKISLMDISGKTVGIIFNDFVNAGYQTIGFDGSSYASGVYFYKLDFSNPDITLTKTKKMLLIK